MRARFAIDQRAIQRKLDQIADRTASRAAAVTQMRVKEGIAATDRIRTGRMLNRVYISEVGRAHYQVRSDEPYAHWQESGRGPVRPIRAKALRFQPKGLNAFVFAKYVRADPGGHFYRRALARLSRRDFTG